MRRATLRSGALSQVKLLSSDMWCGEALAKLQADGLLSAPMVIKLDNADESNYQARERPAHGSGVTAALSQRRHAHSSARRWRAT